MVLLKYRIREKDCDMYPRIRQANQPVARDHYPRSGRFEVLLYSLECDFSSSN